MTKTINNTYIALLFEIDVFPQIFLGTNNLRILFGICVIKEQIT